MARQVYGKETKLAMRPIKQKKRRYYALVFFLVIAIVGAVAGLKMYNDYKRDKGFNEAMDKMSTALQMGDYAGLRAAEKAIAEEAGRNNPRVEAVGHTVLLRALLWRVFTGEPVLISECRKFVSFLKEPLEDDTGKTFDSPYKDEPFTQVADAVVKAIDPMDAAQVKEAQDALNAMDPTLLSEGEKEYWLAISHWAAGEWVPAEAQMKRAVQAADNPHHRFGLARTLDQAGKTPDAITEYNKVISANPAHVGAQAYLLLAELTPEQDPVAAGEAFFTEHEGTVPARVASDLTVVMANALCLQGEEGKARKIIQQAKINDPGYKILLEWAPPLPPEPVEGEEAE